MSDAFVRNNIGLFINESWIDVGSKTLTPTFFSENTVSIVWELLKDCFNDNISSLKIRGFYLMQYYNHFKLLIQNSDDLVQKVLKFVIIVLQSEESTSESDLSLVRTNGNAALIIGAMLKKHANNLFFKSFLELLVDNFSETSTFYIYLNQNLHGIGFRISVGDNLFICCADKNNSREVLWGDIITIARKYHLEDFLEKKSRMNINAENQFLSDLSFVEIIFEDFVSNVPKIQEYFYSRQPFTSIDSFAPSIEIFQSILFLSLPEHHAISYSKFFHSITMHTGKIQFFRFVYGVMAKYFLKKIHSLALNKFLNNYHWSRMAKLGEESIWTTPRMLYFSGLFDCIQDRQQVIKLPIPSNRIDLISRIGRQNKTTIGKYQLNTFTENSLVVIPPQNNFIDNHFGGFDVELQYSNSGESDSSSSSEEISGSELPSLPPLPTTHRPAVWSGSPDYLQPQAPPIPIDSIPFSQLGNQEKNILGLGNAQPFIYNEMSALNQNIAVTDLLGLHTERKSNFEISSYFHGISRPVSAACVQRNLFPVPNSSFSSIRESPFKAQKLDQDVDSLSSSSVCSQSITEENIELSDFIQYTSNDEECCSKADDKRDNLFKELLPKAFPFPEQADLIRRILASGISTNDMLDMEEAELVSLFVELGIFSKKIAEIVVRKMRTSI